MVMTVVGPDRAEHTVADQYGYMQLQLQVLVGPRQVSEGNRRSSGYLHRKGPAEYLNEALRSGIQLNRVARRDETRCGWQK